MSLSVNDRMLLECPENYNEMEEQLGINNDEDTNNKDDSNQTAAPVIESEASKHVEPTEEEEYEELEQSLQALEGIDRSSPDLWPDHIPGVGQFLPATPYKDTPTDTPNHSQSSGHLHNLSREEMETLMQLSSLTVPQLMSEVKRLQNIAYQLGQEESKEMTRGKYLNILKRRTNPSQ